jgi:hypothetical protein
MQQLISSKKKSSMQQLHERVEAAWTNILGLASMLGYINSIARTYPSLEGRVTYVSETGA